MTNDYETLKRISNNWNRTIGLVGEVETSNGPCNITRLVLHATADELEAQTPRGHTAIADELRAIANATPEPATAPTLTEEIEGIKRQLTWYDKRQDGLAERMDDLKELVDEMYSDIRGLKLR